MKAAPGSLAGIARHAPLAALLLFTAIRPTWLLAVGGGLVAGLAARAALGWVRRSRTARRVFAAAVLLGLLGGYAWMVEHPARWSRMREYGVSGETSVSYSAAGNKWEIEHRLYTDQTEFSGARRTPKRPLAADLADQLSPCGWQVEAKGPVLVVSGVKTQEVLSRWFEPDTANVISIPEVQCGDVTLTRRVSPPTYWRFVVDVPRYMIGKAYPDPAADGVSRDGKQHLVIATLVAPDESPSLDLKVANGLLQNRVGAAILRGALWAPLDELLFAIAAILAGFGGLAHIAKNVMGAPTAALRQSED